jgi:REP element-mobilizing transposase RayT
MPRAPRIEFSGALYRVMNRGNHRQRIFGDNKDREMFLATLAETCQAVGWVVHSFVLMPTHFHLLIETMRAKLVKSGEEWVAGQMGMKTRGSLAVGLCMLGKRLACDRDLPKRWKQVKDLQPC